VKGEQLLIWNAGAGRGKDQELLRAARLSFTRCIEPEDPGEFVAAVTLACTDGAASVWIAGGDGSVHAAVNALMTHAVRPPLGILPMGTGNDFCRSLGIPLDPLECLQQRDSWLPAEVDLIAARFDSQTRYVANAANGGGPGQVSAAASRDTKERWGGLAYARAAVDAAASSENAVTAVSIDQKLLPEAPVFGVIAANGKTVGHGYTLVPNASLVDGMFDLLIIHDVSLLDLALLAPRLLSGGLPDAAKVSHHRARQAAVHSPMLFSFDGDPGTESEVAFEIMPRALAVLTPPGAVA